jgi:hypothetical protein
MVAEVPLRDALFGQFVQLGEHMRNRGGNTHVCEHEAAAAHP